MAHTMSVLLLFFSTTETASVSDLLEANNWPPNNPNLVDHGMWEYLVEIVYKNEVIDVIHLQLCNVYCSKMERNSSRAGQKSHRSIPAAIKEGRHY